MEKMKKYRKQAMLTKNTHIIIPATSERNRGGYCFMPYWHYVRLKHTGNNVTLHEMVVPSHYYDMECLQDEYYLIDISDESQIAGALDFLDYLTRELKVPKRNIKTIGFPNYSIGVPYCSAIITKEPILAPLYLSHFKYFDLSDCDGHLKNIPVDNLLIPVYAQVGCRRGCSYCWCSKPSYPYFRDDNHAEFERVAREIKGKVVHFMDEDFLLKSTESLRRLWHICKVNDIKYICLTSSQALESVVNRGLSSELIESGCLLVEVGYESSEDAKNKNFIQFLGTLDREILSRLNLLCMAFGVGDNLRNHWLMGRVLETYGHRHEEVVPRLATNGTVEGLGQFYQMYPEELVDYSKNVTIQFPKNVFHEFNYRGQVQRRLHCTKVPKLLLESHIYKSSTYEYETIEKEISAFAYLYDNHKELTEINKWFRAKPLTLCTRIAKMYKVDNLTPKLVIAIVQFMRKGWLSPFRANGWEDKHYSNTTVRDENFVYVRKGNLLEYQKRVKEEAVNKTLEFEKDETPSNDEISGDV